MTVGSLFTGIGGFDQGFERAGFEIRWQVEIDPFCRQVLKKHWPNVKRYDDVRTVGNELEYADWIVGGFPCQDLSSAGKRSGVDGERSGLWREVVRIVGMRHPRGIVFENVHHSWKRWVPVLRRAVWDIGYASLPIRVRASDFGAWHRRSRVFLVAHVDARLLRLQSWRCGWPFWAAPLFTADADPARCADGEWRGTDAERDRQRSVVADLDEVRELQPQGRESDERRWAGYGAQWATEPDVVRVVHGVSSRVDGRRMAARIGALGNAVVPIQAEWIAQQILAAEERIAMTA